MPLVVPALAAGVAIVMLVIMADVQAQDTPPTPEEVAATVPAPGEQTKSLFDVYKSGGGMMHILALMFIGTVGVAGYCFLQVSAGKMVPKRLVDGVNRTMAERDINGAYSLCQENPNSYSRVLSQALLKVNFERDKANKSSMDEAAAETLDQEETKQMIWVNYLNVFATLQKQFYGQSPSLLFRWDIPTEGLFSSTTANLCRQPHPPPIGQ